MDKYYRRLKRDRLHYQFDQIDKYDKAFNFIISPREPGKSTGMWLKLVKKYFKYGHTGIVFKRRLVDITESWIQSIATQINPFLRKQYRIPKFYFKKGQCGKGMVDIYITEEDMKAGQNPIMRIIALTVPVGRVKSTALDNCGDMYFDEFIIDTVHGEKYAPNEVKSFRDIYDTYKRWALLAPHPHKLKCYFCGNPYSVYNPYFIWLDAPLQDIKPGALLIGKEWLIQCYQVTPELREWILKTNPNYTFDDSYTQYAFGGVSVNDLRYRVNARKPSGYRIRWIFRVCEKFLIVWAKGEFATAEEELNGAKYWVETCNKLPYNNINRTIWAFDINDLITDTQLFRATQYGRRFFVLSYAFTKRNIEFKTVEGAILLEAIFTMLQ